MVAVSLHHPRTQRRSVERGREMSRDERRIERSEQSDAWAVHSTLPFYYPRHNTCSSEKLYLRNYDVTAGNLLRHKQLTSTCSDEGKRVLSTFLSQNNRINKKGCLSACMYILYTYVNAWFNYDRTLFTYSLKTRRTTAW